MSGELKEPKKLGTVCEPIPDGCKEAGCIVVCRNQCLIDCTCECPIHKLEKLDTKTMLTLTGNDSICVRDPYKKHTKKRR